MHAPNQQIVNALVRRARWRRRVAVLERVAVYVAVFGGSALVWAWAFWWLVNS